MSSGTNNMTNQSTGQSSTDLLRRRAKAPIVVFLLAAFATCIGLFYTIENWRGRHAWAVCRQELLARGEQLDVRALIPPPLPDEQNFLKAAPLEAWFRKDTSDTGALALMPRLPEGLKSRPPSLAELKDWGLFAGAFQTGADFPLTDRTLTPAAVLLKWFERYDQGWTALYQAAERKSSRFDTDYSRGVEMEVPNFVAARTVAQALAAHAEANLLVSKPTDAMRDLTVINRMSKTFSSHPTLIGTMIGVAIAGLYDDVVRQGLAEHLWQPAQLVQIQEQAQGFDFISDYSRGMRGGEMANVLQLLETGSRAKLLNVLGVSKGWDKRRDTLFYRLAPRGWLDQNMARYALLICDAMQCIDVGSGRVYPAKCSAIESRMYREVTRAPYHYVQACVVPNLVRALQKVAERQAEAALTSIVCAVERFKAAEGAYPADLAALVPKYISKLPPDPVTGESFKYRKNEQGHCIVYSVGWDLVDAGGGNGDWAWESSNQ
ncbi:MAG TPA: hypothetical protein VL793_12370 [Patescibacteria group bacterium]|nr:hypothetical protein [Patescibacteria group bacterium]